MNTIAKTIFEQLGANRFVAMTGAKNFCQGFNSLQFDIGRGAKNKANKVRITLQTSDTYMIEFFYVRGVVCKTCGEAERNVYADQLQAVFTAATGLDTHL